jgi:uncharacterized membrane protein YozB (DUF420 family)
MSQQKFEGSITGFYILLAVVIIVLIPLGYLYISAVRGLMPASPDLRAVPGFLGTGASRASDISLVAYVLLLVPGMLIGFVFARRQGFSQHKAFMTGVTLLNWGIILYLMGVSYSQAREFAATGGATNLVLPTIHLITGLAAQIIATVSLIRMWFERTLPKSLRYEPIKPQMRLTLGLWLVTAVLGVSIYIMWYGVPFSPRTAQPAGGGVATEQATPGSVATEQATQSASGAVATQQATQSAAATQQAVQPLSGAVATEQATPGAVATEQATPTR